MNIADKIKVIFIIATFLYLSVYLAVSLFWVFKNNNNKENNNISNASKKNKSKQNAKQKRNEST